MLPIGESSDAESAASMWMMHLMLHTANELSVSYGSSRDYLEPFSSGGRVSERDWYQPCGVLSNVSLHAFDTCICIGSAGA